MSGDADLRGSVQIDVSSAVAGLKQVADGYRSLQQASKSMGAGMAAGQRAVGQALIQGNKSTTGQINAQLRASAKGQAQIVAGAQRAAKKSASVAMGGTEAQSRAALGNSRAMTKEMQAQETASKGVSEATEKTSAGLSTLRYAMYDVSRTFRQIGIVMTAIGAAPLGIAIAWEREFANVDRTVQDLDFSQIAYLREQLVDVTRTMPVAFDKVAEIATLAGQMGIAGSRIAGFTRTVAQFSATTGVSVEDASTAFGRLNSLVPDVQNNFGKLADEIVKVGVNSVSTEAEIVQTAIQIAAVAGQAGLASTEIIGLSGALASVAVRPALARGVITRVFGRISRAAAEGGAKLMGFAKLAGMSAGQFQSSWGDPKLGKDTLLALFDGIHKQGKGAESALRELGITSVRDVPVILRLANALDNAGVAGGLLKQTFDDSANSSGEMARQYGIISDTIVSKFQVMVQNIQAALDKIGSTDLGVLGDLLDGITAKIRDFTDTLDDNFKLFGWDLGKTNAEILGIVAVVTLALGALALLVGGFGTVTAGTIAMIQVVQALKVHLGTMAGSAALAGDASLVAGTKMQRAGVKVAGFSKVLVGVTRALLPLAAFAGFAWLTNVVLDANDASTSVDEFAARMNRATGSISDSILSMKGIDFDMFASSSEAAIGRADTDIPFFDTIDEYAAGLEKIQSSGMFTDMWDKLFNYGAFERVTQATDHADDALNNLIQTGESFKAINLFQGMVKDAKLSDKALQGALNGYKHTTHEMRNILASLDLEDTNENMMALARNTLPEYTASVEAASAGTDEFAEVLSAADELATAFVKSMGGHISGMVSTSEAWAEAVEADKNKAKAAWEEAGNDVADFKESGTASLDSFLDALDAQVAAQAEFGANLAEIYRRGGAEAAEAAYAAGADITAKLANGSETQFARFLEDVPHMGEEFGATYAQAMADLGTPQAVAAFARMGDKAADKMRAKVLDGTADINDILAAWKPSFHIEAKTHKAEQQARALRSYISSLTATMTVHIQQQVTRNLIPGGHPMQGGYRGSANGSMESYAGGGFPTGIYKGRKGSIHKFAEPETGWEAYISGKPGQEKRNRAILLDAAERLGMNASSVVGNKSGNYAQSASSRTSSGGNKVSVVELSAYDRKLLAQAGNVQLSIGNEQVARANSRANAVSAKRGSN